MTLPATPEPPPIRVSFAEALRYWLRLGFISFGGPAGQIAIMHEELVTRRRWISERRFLHALNYCMVLPGPEAQQLATYIGWLMHGVKGGIAAGALFVLPSLVILIALSWIYVTLGDVPVVAGILYGIKPAVTAIVLHAAWRIGRRALRHPSLWAIAALAFVAIAVAKLPFPLIIGAAAVAGALAARAWPDAFRPAGHAARGDGGAALIDDGTPPPAHARFQPSRFAMHAAIGLALWGAVLGGLFAVSGADGLFARMGEFFTKAALLTFGGAYAVLPYVVQATVLDYAWLTPTQMIDGLALGETTPGPLIMIVAFVGFVGAWQAAPLASLFWSGAAGAGVATFFTFLPSFLFILLGGPLVEATRGDIKFTAPLTGITAAVAGVIVNLALFFATAVFWPQGLDGPFEWPAAVIGIAAAIALLRYDAAIIRTIGACAAAGLLVSLLR
jgi:chromate transporter